MRVGGDPRGRPARRRPVASRLVAVAALAVGTIAAGFKPVVVLLAIFVVLTPFERLAPRHRQRIRRPDLGTDIAFAILSGPMQIISIVAGVVLGIVCLAWLPGLLLRPVVASIPDGWRLVAGVLLFDLAGYWGHRLGHQVPFLWRFHQVHHSH